MQTIERDARRIYDSIDRASNTFYRAVGSIARRLLFNWILKAAGEEWSYDGEDQTPYYKRFFQKAQNEILVVTSGFNSRSILQSPIIELLGEKVDRGVDLEVVLGTESSTLKEAEVDISRDFPQILDLKHQYPDKISLYWENYPEALNFSVVNREHLIWEAREADLPFDYTINTPLPLTAIYNDSGPAEYFVNLFYQIRNRDVQQVA